MPRSNALLPLRALGLRLVLLSALLLAGIAATGPVRAETAPVGVDAELMQKRMEEFQKWRASIPDYEMRLYDRVKDVNNRVVALQRVVIGGVLMVLVGVPLSVWLLLRHLGAGLGGGDKRQGTGFRDPFAGSANTRLTRKLLARQQVIIDSLAELSAFAEESRSSNTRLDSALRQIMDESDAVRNEIEVAAQRPAQPGNG